MAVGFRGREPRHPERLVDAAFASSSDFFALPRATKGELAVVAAAQLGL